MNSVFDPEEGRRALRGECARRALDLVSDLNMKGLTENEVLATLACALGIHLVGRDVSERRRVGFDACQAVWDIANGRVPSL